MQEACEKQAGSKQQAHAKWAKNHSSIVVLQIGPKFWWMLPMGVRDNHIKYEPDTQWWRPETGVASAGPPFQNVQLRAKTKLFLPKPALEPAENGQIKGNNGYSTHVAKLPRVEGPSRAFQLHCTSANTRICEPSPHPQTKNTAHLGLRDSIAPNPPATTHFWWFPPPQNCPNQRLDPHT